MTIQEQLRRDEGLKLKPYRDSAGKLTIGVGRNLDDCGISEGEAEVMLDNDIARVNRELHAYLPWTDSLDEVRRAVLVNMAFNVGTVSLLHFRKTLAHAQAGRYAEAAAEMLNSDWEKQVGPRAHRLAKQMETGDWQ